MLMQIRMRKTCTGDDSVVVMLGIPTNLNDKNQFTDSKIRISEAEKRVWSDVSLRQITSATMSKMEYSENHQTKQHS